MKKNSSARPLPNVASWKPRDASRSLSAALEKQCQNAEARILQGLRHESDFSVDNFESGLPFEALVRQELRQLLPRRYSISAGLLLDRNGKTAGKCDAVLFNDIWFAPVKAPITKDAGQPYIPIESAYAVGEIKQTMSAATLDKAMEKLVTCHRLNRPRTFAHRLVENRESNDCPHGLTNPLFSFIIAGSVSKSETFESIVERFYQICRGLKRLEVVRILCVLGEGVIVWGFRDLDRHDEIRPALFLEGDLFHSIFPALLLRESRNPLYSLIENLQQALFQTVLGPEDVAVAYSSLSDSVRIPTETEISLPPDKEWLDLLSVPCRRGHD
jgi:hypothetical protein